MSRARLAFATRAFVIGDVLFAVAAYALFGEVTAMNAGEIVALVVLFLIVAKVGYEVGKLAGRDDYRQELRTFLQAREKGDERPVREIVGEFRERRAGHPAGTLDHDGYD